MVDKEQDRARLALVAGIGAAVVVIGGGLCYLAFRPAPAEPEPSPEPSSPPRWYETSPTAPPAALVWSGPANAAQVGSARFPAAWGVPTEFETCTGDGSPSCGQIADGWKDQEGRRLPALRRALKLPASGPLVLAAFSAGGHLIRRVLEDERDRAEIAGVVLADATYTTEWESKKAGRAAPIPSFVLYGRDVLREPGRLFVATASTWPNKEHPSGVQTLEAIARALDLPEVNPGVVRFSKSPDRVWRPTSGGLAFFDFSRTYSHAGHATELAREVWAELVIPHFRQAAEG